jgi:hypothetical protein
MEELIKSLVILMARLFWYALQAEIPSKSMVHLNHTALILRMERGKKNYFYSR